MNNELLRFWQVQPESYSLADRRFQSILRSIKPGLMFISTVSVLNTVMYWDWLTVCRTCKAPRGCCKLSLKAEHFVISNALYICVGCVTDFHVSVLVYQHALHRDLCVFVQNLTYDTWKWGLCQTENSSWKFDLFDCICDNTLGLKFIFSCKNESYP